jgi:ABC-type nitrate/sulfonate/bicarbonate transport system substrate-binding protein
LDNLDATVEDALEEVIDASIEVVDEHFSHLTGNQRADQVIAFVANWLQSMGVEWLEEHQDEVTDTIRDWVQERFSALREKIEEWRAGREGRQAERQSFRASQQGKSRDEKKAARKGRRQARRAARRS